MYFSRPAWGQQLLPVLLKLAEASLNDLLREVHYDPPKSDVKTTKAYRVHSNRKQQTVSEKGIHQRTSEQAQC